METRDILRRLPHDLPFVFLDRVLHVDENRGGVGLKNVTVNEPFFRGHFPQDPVFPGVLLLESMAQLAGVVAGDAEGGGAFLGGLSDARFLRPVVPGDQVVLRVSVEGRLGEAVRFSGTAEVDRETVARASFSLVFRPPAPPPAPEAP